MWYRDDCHPRDPREPAEVPQKGAKEHRSRGEARLGADLVEGAPLGMEDSGWVWQENLVLRRRDADIEMLWAALPQIWTVKCLLGDRVPAVRRWSG